MADETQLAQKKIIALLSRREYSQAALLAKLTQQGFHPQATRDALHALAQQGLQSDRRFAESLVSSKRSRGYGPVHIAMHLQEHHVDALLIAQLLDEQRHNWQLCAEQVRAKKFGDSKPSDYQNQAKQKRFLSYRGFSSDCINAIFHERF